ncbi:MAG: PHP domain-containing protein [Bryobacteraceae bacterium]
MIDLHSHTTASDGTFSPAQLVDEAGRAGVRILGITDHDTFSGYDQAVPLARKAGLELVCGIELSTKLHGHSVHLLGYFLNPSIDPSLKPNGLGDFRTCIGELQASRLDRNVRLIARLRELGVNVTLEEVQARGGGMTGRPHFAQLLVEKGYVRNMQQAFDDYLDESAKGYVNRREPQFEEAVQRIRKAGGIASLAHPVRIREDLAAILPELRAAGLNAIEAYHSDHDPSKTALYLELAAQNGLLVTGGSDFHGAVKPEIQLGTGRGENLKVPEDLVDRLRET